MLCAFDIFVCIRRTGQDHILLMSSIIFNKDDFCTFLEIANLTNTYREKESWNNTA